MGSFVESAPFDGDARSLRLVLGLRGGVVVHGTIGPGKPPPGAHVQIGIASTHTGSFAVPIAAAGTFTATLPRGARYEAALLGGISGPGEAAPAGDRAELAVSLRSYGPPPQAVVDWIAAHAIPLATAEPGHGFADMAAIGPLVGKARVVALGEATHGTREFFQLKHRMLEYLVATQGFTVFAIEADQPECRAINDYVLHGTGDARGALDGMHKWPWSTAEVLAMIEWMRAWNADPAHPRKVQFAGFDMLTSRVAYASVARFLARVAPDAAPGLLAPIAALAGEMVVASAAVAALTDDGVQQLRGGLAALARRSTLIASHGRARPAAPRSTRLATTRRSSSRPASGTSTRAPAREMSSSVVGRWRRTSCGSWRTSPRGRAWWCGRTTAMLRRRPRTPIPRASTWGRTCAKRSKPTTSTSASCSRRARSRLRPWPVRALA